MYSVRAFMQVLGTALPTCTHVLSLPHIKSKTYAPMAARFVQRLLPGISNRIYAHTAFTQRCLCDHSQTIFTASTTLPMDRCTPPKAGSRGRGGNKPKRRKVQKKLKSKGDGTPDELLLIDVKNLLARAQGEEGGDGHVYGKATPEEQGPTGTDKTLPERFTTVELTIHELGSNGEGLAYSAAKDHIYIVPFTLPGDVVKAKIHAQFQDYSLTDFVEVVEPSEKRNDGLIKCRYFGTCGGCQFQMLPYPEQLAHKRRVIEKAYENFSGLDPAVIPEIGPTWGSPLQYNYRTKLTPHFNIPRGGLPEGSKPPVGFQKKGQRLVIDIEDCPIGTPAIREGLARQRKLALDTIHQYKRGATILLRESTMRRPKENGVMGGGEEYDEEKICVTDNNATITEYIGKFKFLSLANAFFQNNNSILDEFTSFVRDNLHIPVSVTTELSNPPTVVPTLKYLVDAYCGSGLFSITCGSAFDRVVGVDVSKESIEFASKNAESNGIKNASFIEGNAEKIFEKIDFPGSETSVIIDPPRKGSDQAFLDQLLDLAPRRIVYISCNVHTQARDLGYLLNHTKGVGYKINSIRGFDFFPQVSNTILSVIIGPQTDSGTDTSC